MLWSKEISGKILAVEIRTQNNDGGKVSSAPCYDHASVDPGLKQTQTCLISTIMVCEFCHTETCPLKLKSE